MQSVIIILPYSRKIKFGSWIPNRHCKNIGEFKLGGSVRNYHIYMKYWWNLISRLQRQIANPPNLNSPLNFPAIRYTIKSRPDSEQCGQGSLCTHSTLPYIVMYNYSQAIAIYSRMWIIWIWHYISQETAMFTLLNSVKGSF